MTDATSKIDVRRPNVGNLLIQILVHCALLGLVFLSWVGSERIQCV